MLMMMTFTRMLLHAVYKNSVLIDMHIVAVLLADMDSVPADVYAIVFVFNMYTVRTDVYLVAVIVILIIIAAVAITAVAITAVAITAVAITAVTIITAVFL